MSAVLGECVLCLFDSHEACGRSSAVTAFVLMGKLGAEDLRELLRIEDVLSSGSRSSPLYV